MSALVKTGGHICFNLMSPSHNHARNLINIASNADPSGIASLRLVIEKVAVIVSRSTRKAGDAPC